MWFEHNARIRSASIGEVYIEEASVGSQGEYREESKLTHRRHIRRMVSCVMAAISKRLRHVSTICTPNCHGHPWIDSWKFNNVFSEITLKALAERRIFYNVLYSGLPTVPTLIEWCAQDAFAELSW